MKAFIESRKPVQHTTITNLKAMWHDWGLNQNFRKAMLYGTLSGVANVPSDYVTKRESKWMVQHGYVWDSETQTVEL